MSAEQIIPTLLLIAWLAPLASFAVSAIGGSVLARRVGGVDPNSARAIGQVATGAITLSLLASLLALSVWLYQYPPTDSHSTEDGHITASHVVHEPIHLTGDWFKFLDVGSLTASAGYYIDSLTIVMCVVVTLIATCVHFYSFGYLADELAEGGDDAVVDHEALLADGSPLQRAGRLHRYYQHLSLFCFSMMGVVLANNVLMTFVFWELVGASSYLLIGFYYERSTASRASAKAMLVNRIGDAGMLIGLMALWGQFGTLDYDQLFANAPAALAGTPADYTLICLAGLGLFCGAVGKSAQVPLQTWLPDAMAGPTPVSALVHSATMVAAGVFLVGRIYPLLTPEALLVIALTGAITLLLGALFAIAANDLKRILAYSTISQLGYMMLGLGLGGWTAGLFHLVTHAAFKSLLFLGAGSVIHAVHTNDLSEMGGLRHKLPRTALLMIIAALALVGAGLPLVGLGLSGFYSKDLLFEQAIAFTRANPKHVWLFWAPAIGATMTAFYISRLWLLAFVGEPRSEASSKAHESPRSMLLPMTLLAALAIGIGWSVPWSGWSVESLLAQAAPTVESHAQAGKIWPSVTIPSEAATHTSEIKNLAGYTALGATLLGIAIAYGLHQTGRLLAMPGSQMLRTIDEQWLPAINRGIESSVRGAGALVARGIDAIVIDGTLGLAARSVWFTGLGLHRIETGSLRQYVVFLVLGVVFVGSVALAVAYRWVTSGVQ